MANVFTGWSDPPLSPCGREEAPLFANRLAAARIFCAPLIRVTETVAILRRTPTARPSRSRR